VVRERNTALSSRGTTMITGSFSSYRLKQEERSITILVAAREDSEGTIRSGGQVVPFEFRLGEERASSKGAEG
jgi:hypothetical protein